MKRVLLRLVLPACVLLLMTSTSFSSNRGISVEARIPGGGEKKISLYSGYHALVIGCGNYRDPSLGQLKGAIRDAKEVDRALRKLGFKTKLVLNPDSEGLENAFYDFAGGPGSDPDKAIFIFFAGHGHTLPQADGTPLGYIVPVDAPNPNEKPGRFMSRAMSMSEIADVSQLIQSKHVLMVFDSCFSGAIFRSRDLTPSPYIREQVAEPVRAFIAAGRENERVPDQSVFKTCLIQGLVDRYADLNNDGFITGEELGLYLKKEVVNYTRGAQHPHFGRINNPKLDKGDFVFAGVTVFEPGKPSLTVRSNVRGARVTVDGRYIGTTPVRNHEVSKGRHLVEVSKEGYEPNRERVTLGAGEKATHRVTLKKETPDSARLYVDSDPSDARVRILNIHPKFYQGIELTPGSYHLEVSADRHHTRKEWIELAAGDEERVQVTLTLVAEPVRVSKPAEPSKGDTWTDPVTGMEFVWVTGGCFMMGQSESEKTYLIREVGEADYKDYYSDELPRHRVCVDGFWMGKTEVTRGQFREFVREMGYKTDAEKKGKAKVFNKDTDWKWKELPGYNWKKVGYSQNDTHPAACISWNDAKAFADWLSRKTGRRVQLPTEAQWEYAARGGTDGMRFWGSDDSDACRYANAADKGNGWKTNFPCDDGYEFTAPVGNYRPNPFGLYDMLGNVWEWCADWHGDDYYSRSPKDDPRGPSSGRYRVLRGGAWLSVPRSVRAADRGWGTPDNRGTDHGFRLVAVPPQ